MATSGRSGTVRKPKNKTLGPDLKRLKKRSVKSPALPQERFKQDVLDGADNILAAVIGKDLDLPPSELNERLVRLAKIQTTLSVISHLDAVAAAYALYVHDAGQGFVVGQAVMNDRLLGTDLPNVFEKRRKNYDLLRVYLPIFISYDASEEPAEASSRGDWYYCRDARAIRYLMDKGVGPDRLVEYAEPVGEGLDEWARRGKGKAAPPDPIGSESQPVEATEDGSHGTPRLSVRLLGKLLANIEVSAKTAEFVAYDEMKSAELRALVQKFLDEATIDAPVASAQTPTRVMNEDEYAVPCLVINDPKFAGFHFKPSQIEPSKPKYRMTRTPSRAIRPQPKL